jgi:hypothetical protein
MCELRAGVGEKVGAEFQKRCEDASHSNSEGLRETGLPVTAGRQCEISITRQERQESLRRSEIPTNRKRWAKCAAGENIVIQVPNRRLTCARIEQQIIGPAVPIEIG